MRALPLEIPSIRRCTTKGLLVAAVAIVALGSARAAEVTASATPTEVAPGESAQIEVRIELGPGEEASVFMGGLDLDGDGSVVEALDGADLTPGGPTWGSSFGSVDPGRIDVSLTSATNLGGNRLVATLTVVGMDPGTFAIALGAGTFAQRDIPVPPFLEDVPIETPLGTTLVEVAVAAPPVPMTPGGWLALAALSILGAARSALPRVECPSLRT